MSNRSPASRRARWGVALAALGLLACDTNVLNPALIAQTDIDPKSSAAQTILTLSAQQSTWVALNSIVWAEGVFTGEAWTTNVNTASPDFGRRTLAPLAGNNQAPTWYNPLQTALAANEQAIQLLKTVAGADTSQNLARASMYSGMLLQHLGETSCVGVITGGPPLTPVQTLDTAIVRLQQAVAIGTMNGGVAAESLATAANVTLAQVYLQLQQYGAAITTAALVPANFTFSANYVVNLASLSRVSNLVYEGGTGGSGKSWVVPPAFQALNDPRVPWKDLNKLAFDTVEFVELLKYTSDASPIRMASSLEASYISAEANLQMGNTAPALSLDSARRVAGGQAPFGGSGAAAILAELMDQKSRDFWMEGKRMGDYQRNPASVPYVSPAGTPFYTPNLSTYGNEICFPLTLNESQANSHFPAGYVSPQYTYPPGMPAP
jgi:hypothetical protein